MARYTAYYGLLAGVWERVRTSMDPSRDVDLDEVFTPEGLREATIAQMAANLSSGVVDTRSEQYGASMIDFTPAPVEWAGRIATGAGHGVAGLLSGENPLDPEEDNMKQFYRTLQGNVPGFATADKIKRMTMDGERLFVQPEDR